MFREVNINENLYAIGSSAFNDIFCLFLCSDSKNSLYSLCDLPFLPSPSSPQTLSLSLSWLVFQFWFLFMHEWNANLAQEGKKNSDHFILLLYFRSFYVCKKRAHFERLKWIDFLQWRKLRGALRSDSINPF